MAAIKPAMTTPAAIKAALLPTCWISTSVASQAMHDNYCQTERGTENCVSMYTLLSCDAVQTQQANILKALFPAESDSCTCCNLKQDYEADSCRFGAH